MKTTYSFEDDLGALRVLLFRENHFAHPGIQPEHDSLRKLLIPLSKFYKAAFPEKTQDECREFRLRLLSRILECRVTTTYDLTLHQCTTLARFLHYGLDTDEREQEEECYQEFDQRSIQLFADLTDRLEGTHLSGEGFPAFWKKLVGPTHHELLTDLSRLFEDDLGQRLTS